jgi:hypothetical protein
VAKGMAIGQRRPEKLWKAITFKPELDFGQGFSRWEVISRRNASRKSNFELVKYVLHKLMKK